MTTQQSIENNTITISIKMLWTFLVSFLIASISVGGFYISFLTRFSDLKSEVSTNKTTQTGIDQVQNLQLENIKLNVQKIEIDLKDYSRKMDSKKDK